MNIYTLIILATIVISYTLDFISNFLNLKTFRNPLPEYFKGLCSHLTYQNAQEFNCAETKFKIVTSTTGLAVIVGFWFSGGFNYLDLIVRDWGLGIILTGLSYIGILVLAKAITSLPFQIYSNFFLIKRFGGGFDTPKIFINNILKASLLTLILGVPLLAGVLAFFEYGGSNAWVYGWTVTSMFTLIILLYSPSMILPLFAKFTPLEEGELRDATLSYLRDIRFPYQNIYIQHGQRNKAQAFCTGLGQNKRVVFTDGLISCLNVAEVEATLAHIIGSYQKKHILQNILISTLHMGVMFYLLSIFLNHKGLFEAFYMKHMSIYTGLIFFGMLYSPIEFILSIFTRLLSRKHIVEADRFAAETIDNPENLICALKKMAGHNNFGLPPKHRFYVFLNYDYYTTLERIRRIQALKTSDKKVVGGT